MTVRPYVPEDYPLINDWWQARHGALSDIPQSLLPPLGVMVMEEGEPVFAMFCYETFQSPLAILEYPVSRPNRSLTSTREAFKHAIRSLVKLAGQCCDPPAKYSVFMANPSASLFRAMKDEGFAEAYPDARIPAIFIAGE